jgi:transposase InsO family protein
MEGLFAALKKALIYHRPYQTRQGAKQDFFETIHVWYNHKRRHSSLGYCSPEQFEYKKQYLMAA